MADRSVIVRLLAVTTPFSASMRAAGREVADVQAKIKAGDADTQKVLKGVSRGMMVVGAAGVAGAGLAIRAFANFDQAMSNVQAATHESAEAMGDLSEAALQAGKDTVFSATEAAGAIEALAKAGVSTENILKGGLDGALALAAAGSLDVAEAAEIAASALTTFGLSGADVPHVADLLAAGAGKAQGEVGDLALALRQSGAVAAQMGLSIEDTIGALAEFASVGLTGSDAGTSFKQMLLSLIPSSEEAGKTMERLGISFFDAQGNLKPFNEIAQELQRSMAGLTKEQQAANLKTLFGADAYRVAAVAMEGGSEAALKWRDAVNDQGYAAETAAIKLDNLRGDVEALQGSFETALIQSGTGANDALRGVAQAATGAVNAFADLPAGVQTGATAVAGVGGAALIAVGGIGTLIPKVQAARTALVGMGVAGQFANRSLGALGRLGAVAGGVLIYAGSINILERRLEKLIGLAVDVDDLALSLQKLGETGKVSGTAAKSLGGDLEDLEEAFAEVEKGRSKFYTGLQSPTEITDIFVPGSLDSLEDARQRLDELDRSLTALVKSGDQAAASTALDTLVSKMGLSGGRAKEFRAQFDEYNTALEDSVDPANAAAEASTNMGTALEDVTIPAVEDATAALEDYKSALDDTAAIDAYTATANLAEAFADLTEKLKDGGKVTNDEKVSLGGFATEIRRTASAVLDQTGSQEKANEVMSRGQEKFAKLAEQAGYSATEARKLARRLLEIPEIVPIALNLKATGLDPALSKIAELRRQAGVPIAVTVGTINKLNASGMAEGGWVAGPVKGRDSVPRMLMPGEFVVRESVARRHAPWLEAINSGQRPIGMAAGGWVGPVTNTTHAGVSQENHFHGTNPREGLAEATLNLRRAVFERTGVVV